MTDSTPSRPGLKQGGSDAQELYLELFGGEVLTAFQTLVQMRDKHTVKSLSGGKDFRFPAIWRTSASYHTPGQEILGNQIAHSEIKVSPDDKLIADVFVSDIDEILSHYDFRGPYAQELGAVLARFYDANVIRRIVQAARSGALFTGDTGGSQLVNAGYTTDADLLIEGLSTAKQTMDQKDVPVSTSPLYAMLKPAQWYMLARSEKSLNKFYNGSDNSIRKMQLDTVDEISVLKSNLTPFGVNDSANAAIPAKYRANFTNTAAVVWTPQAAATAEVQSVSTQIVDQPHKQGTLMISRMMCGTDVLRSKCAVELAIA
jgi:hypothetical protein